VDKVLAGPLDRLIVIKEMQSVLVRKFRVDAVRREPSAKTVAPVMKQGDGLNNIIAGGALSGLIHIGAQPATRNMFFPRIVCHVFLNPQPLK